MHGDERAESRLAALDLLADERLGDEVHARRRRTPPGTTIPSRPSSAMPSMTPMSRWWLMSFSIAFGSMRSSTNWRTVACTSRCSGVSSKSTAVSLGNVGLARSSRRSWRRSRLPRPPRLRRRRGADPAREGGARGRLRAPRAERRRRRDRPAPQPRRATAPRARSCSSTRRAARPRLPPLPPAVGRRVAHEHAAGVPLGPGDGSGARRAGRRRRPRARARPSRRAARRAPFRRPTSASRSPAAWPRAAPARA